MFSEYEGILLMHLSPKRRVTQSSAHSTISIFYLFTFNETLRSTHTRRLLLSRDLVPSSRLIFNSDSLDIKSLQQYKLKK